MRLKVLDIIGKNLKEMKRSKLSSLIIVLGPILIILLAGAIFSSNTLQGVKIAFYENEETVLGKNLINKFEEKSFEVEKFSNLDTCINSVKTEKNNLCIQVEETGTNPLGRLDPRINSNVNIYVDYSKTRVIWTIIGEVQTLIESESNEATYSILGTASTQLTRAINEINSKESELDILIEEGESIKTALESSEANINSLSIQIYELNSKATLALGGLETFHIQMNDYIDDVESQTGVTPATTNMRSMLQTHRQSVYGALSGVQSLSQGFYASDLQQEIPYASQNVEALISELESVKDSIQDVNSDFENFEKIAAEEIIDPIPTTYNSILGSEEGKISKELNFFDYILPGLLTMVIMFASILLTATLTVRERKTKAYQRSILTTTPKATFTFGNFITALIIIFIQTAVLLLATKLIFNSNIFLSLHLIVLSALIISSFFILAGIIIGHIFNSEETTVIASVSTGIIFLISSSMILSIEAMPKIIGGIVKYTPFVLAETILRKITIFQLFFVNILPELLILLFYIIGSVFLISIIQHYQKS